MGARLMRVEDWPLRLDAWVRDAQARAFAWGTWDCGLAPADWSLRATGADPAAWFRGRYQDEQGAYQALRDFAGGGVREAWQRSAAELGWPEVPKLRAQRGDIALVVTQTGTSAGVVLGARVAVVARAGLALVSLRDADLAWRL
jgi:hypothetical protein